MEYSTEKEGSNPYGKDERLKRSRISTRDKWVRLSSLGLFANSHIDYKIELDKSEQPNLEEIAIGDLKSMHADDEPCFLLLRPDLLLYFSLSFSSKADRQVEAGRIDHAGHANDAPRLIHGV